VNPVRNLFFSIAMTPTTDAIRVAFVGVIPTEGTAP